MTIETTGSTALADVQRELERELDERLAVLQDLAPYAVPSVDPVAFQTAASHRVAVEQITAALNRLAKGTYGLCTRCGEPIAPARLEVLPYAAACIECQSRADAA
ncbi:TraR/DksA family transcriptional regulator [Microbacterium sp. F51-2R]|uniref:TraR/DksA family transcriptional regulator n=1 Tax=Microbacterium sp. F51-2R TaxID=3445777 RepID=UPI003FA0676A